ncbi:MAG: T9SS type A sorting domain-containing protein [Saprospiraceae bacterium]
MRSLILCILLSSLYNLHAQDTTSFAPIGAVWHYNSYGHDSPFYFKFVVEKDTLILGENARLLRYYVFENDTFHADNNLNKYVITDGAKVYYKVENEFVLLYDFAASAGDTIFSRAEYYPVNMGCYPEFENGSIDYSYKIDSVNVINIDGIDLRRQYLHVIDPPGASTPWFFINPVIERIGANDYGGFWWGQGGGCILEDNGFLRCYEDQDIFYKNPYAQFQYECDYTGTNELEPSPETFIFPNPTTDFISLLENAKEINLFNSTGQKIRSYKNQDRIDVSFLSPGIYFIQFQINSKNYIRKFLKI